MRRAFLVVPLGFLALTLAVPTQEAKKVVHLESEYFPLRVGTARKYKVNDHEVTITVAREELLELKKLQPDPDDKDKKKTREVKVKVLGYQLESRSEDRVQSETVAVLEDGLYRCAALGKAITPPVCVLKLPPQPGQSWQVQAMTDGQTVQGTFRCVEENVKEWKNAIKCFSDDFQIGKQKMKLATWFVPGMGLVKQEVHVGGYDIVMDLIRVTSPEK